MVIAIIAILASMLLPSLNKAKSKTKQMLCMNQLKQIALPFQLYIDDHDDHIPYGYWYNGSGSINVAYDDFLVPYFGHTLTWAQIAAGDSRSYVTVGLYRPRIFSR